MSGFLGSGSGGGGGSLGGDASGSSGSVTVTKIQNNPIASGTPSDGQILTWDAGSGEWKPKAPPVIVSGSGSDGYGVYTCLVGMSVGQVVYLSGTDTVGLANATDSTKLAIGVIVSKNTSTQAVVAWEGEISVFSGLVAGQTYYLGTTDGTITAVAPSATGNIVQKVGEAKDSNTLLCDFDTNYVQL
jgi:hypothetical protein